MKKHKIREAVWYPTAVAICIGVLLYVLLTRFPAICGIISTFIGYFKPVIIGAVIAYIVNPLSGLFEKLFKGIKKEKVRTALSNVLAFLVVILFLAFSLVILVPQLIQSVELFASNLNGYIDSINQLLENWGISKNIFDLDNFISSSETILSTVSQYIIDNIESILSTSANVGKNLFQWGIAFILSIYLLGDKKNLKTGFQRLLRAVFKGSRYDDVSIFLHKCHLICNRYIVFNLIDSLIIGAVNAIFMSICGMQYVGLISFVVALTNLIPTFGPMIGAVISGFFLLLVYPIHALMFIVFTMILQTCDAYVIKPRLFGNSLGVSGLWILIGVIVGGNMFGIIGILLAIPCVAIIDFVYTTYFLPRIQGLGAPKQPSPDENPASPDPDPGDRPSRKSEPK